MATWGDSNFFRGHFRQKPLRRTVQFLKRAFLPPKPFPEDNEAKFLSSYAKQFASHRRSAAILAIITWLAYVRWDYFHKDKNPLFENVFPYVVSLRMLGLLLLIAFLFCMKSKTYLNDKKVSAVLSMMVITSYSILSIMVCLVTKYNVLYYIGLLLVLLFLYGMLRLRAKYVIINSGICLAISLACRPFIAPAFEGSPLPADYFLTVAISYLFSFMITGTAIAVQLERSAREGFSREQRLSVVRNEITKTNAALVEAQRETAAKTDALLAAKDAVREAVEQKNRDKSRFLASAAHDLRQPMQALSNLLEASLHSFDKGEIDNGSRMLAMAREAASLSRSTFNAVLDISRLESGFVEATYSNFDITELLEEVTAGQGVQAAFAGVEIRRRKSRKGEAILVHSDRHLLGRIIVNLVSNAIKYSDPRKAGAKAVIISAVAFINRVRVDVIDNGIGIRRTEWESIFKPFVQLNNRERDRSKGVGLGLSIVHASVELLEGHRLDMTSKTGKGTRFSIEIPIAHDGYARADVISSLRDDVGIDATDLEGVYVLYVEDDPLVRQSTQAVFDAHGILVEAFGSVGEMANALPAFERMPDVIVTDYRLPDNQTAEDVVKTAREALGEDIPVVVVTGEVGLAGREGWQLLHKPATPVSLLASISRAIPSDLWEAE